MDLMALRLDGIKKILAVFHYEKNRFNAICPEIEDIIYSIDMRHRIEKVIEEKSFINEEVEGAKEISDVHNLNTFEQNQVMAERISNEKNRMGGPDGLVAIENQIKVLYFSKNIEGNDARMNKKLN